jgi:hypothetical protein
MYKHMRTNLPKEIMAYIDYPFHPNENSFVHHSEVLKYLESYTEKFNLYKVIKFYRHVKQVRPIEIDGQVTWEVITVDVRDSNQLETKEIFDAVMVCNGHYSQPSDGKIQDLDTFEGTKIHSHDYRDPNSVSGRTVVCQGAGRSGIDIALELSVVCKKVVLSDNAGRKFDSLPVNVELVGQIERAEQNGFVLNSGARVKADALVMCVGYDYTFPFLHNDCRITIEDNKVVSPLYKHIININYPTMAIIGVPFIVLPFVLMDIQARFFLRTLDQQFPVPLPPRDDMLSDMRSDRERRFQLGIPFRHTHNMAQEQWDYAENLILVGQLEDSFRLPPVIRMVFEAVHKLRTEHIDLYKNYIVTISGPSSFQIEGKNESTRNHKVNGRT